MAGLEARIFCGKSVATRCPYDTIGLATSKSSS